MTSLDSLWAHCRRWDDDYNSTLSPPGDAVPPSPLSPDQLTVAQLRAKNLSVSEIADYLEISRNAVYGRLKLITYKLGTATPAGLREALKQKR